MFQTVTVSYLSKKNFKGSWHVCFCMNDKIFLCAILNPASLRQMQMNVFFCVGKIYTIAHLTLMVVHLAQNISISFVDAVYVDSGREKATVL